MRIETKDELVKLNSLLYVLGKSKVEMSGDGMIKHINNMGWLQREIEKAKPVLIPPVKPKVKEIKGIELVQKPIQPVKSIKKKVKKIKKNKKGKK